MKFLVVFLAVVANAYAWPAWSYPGRTYGYYGAPAVSSYGAPSVFPTQYASPVAFTAPVSYKTTLSSPSAKAALAYLNTLPLDTCGRQAITFIEDILAGGSSATATAKATNLYIADWNNGQPPAPGSACAAAEVAWKQAAALGQDPVLASALAFMKFYKSDSPCGVSAFDYVNAILTGAKHIDANLIASKSFIAQLKANAANGKSTIDPVCAESALAYASSSEIPSSPNAAAMQAFIAKALETGNGLDPVCLASAEQFIGGYTAGQPELKSNLQAAKTFISLYAGSSVPASQSPCAAATKAYAAAAPASSLPNEAAMLAFIDEAILSNDDGLSPACAAAAVAYISAFETGASELAANAAAGEAFLNAVEANPSIGVESSCAKSYRAYQNVVRG